MPKKYTKKETKKKTTTTTTTTTTNAEGGKKPLAPQTKPAAVAEPRTEDELRKWNRQRKEQLKNVEASVDFGVSQWHAQQKASRWLRVLLLTFICALFCAAAQVVRVLLL
jgi:hypothetical protein